MLYLGLFNLTSLLAMS